jgi:Protein of unknown function (DUF2971).
MALFSGDLPPRTLLYHYTNPETLQLILGSKSIRLSSLARMNDARESRKWYPSLQVDVEGGVTNDEHRRWLTEIDEALRQRSKVACFTGDRFPSGPGEDGDEFHRGYARARMWDQYADHHKGACLIFDQVVLVQQAEHALGIHGAVRFGRVSYIDRRVGDAKGMLWFNASDLRRGVAEAAEQYLDSNWQELLLTKNLDWASEEERRILFVEPGSIETIREFNFGGSLVSVVLGESSKPELQAQVVALARSAGLPSGMVAQCSWFGGSPQVVPLPPAL